jgi:hypothetical protein
MPGPTACEETIAFARVSEVLAKGHQSRDISLPDGGVSRISALKQPQQLRHLGCSP